MPTLADYIALLEDKGTVWPRPPKLEKPKATPAAKPLPGLRAVTWNVYGTLLRIADGELLFDHPQTLRMQVALEKTVEEFNMWNSMHRTPEAPWEYMDRHYKDVLDEQRLTGTGRRGDKPAVVSSRIWRKLIAQLEQKEYAWDVSLYGDADALAEKVAYFFHARLQGLEAAPHALKTLRAIGGSPIEQGLFADSQPFTIPQLLTALGENGTSPQIGELFEPELLVLSHQLGCAKPSPTLTDTLVERIAGAGLEPNEVLHVSNRLEDDLAVAKRAGLRTALYAGDTVGLRATKEQLQDPKLRPDRLVTDLAQVLRILRIA